MNLWDSGWQSLDEMPRFQEHSYWLQDNFASSPYLDLQRTETLNREDQLAVVSLKEEGPFLRPLPLLINMKFIVNIDMGAWSLGQLG